MVDRGQGHRHMLEDFKKRLIVSLILTVPVLLLSQSMQQFFGFHLQFQALKSLFSHLQPLSISMAAIPSLSVSETSFERDSLG